MIKNYLAWNDIKKQWPTVSGLALVIALWEISLIAHAADTTLVNLDVELADVRGRPSLNTQSGLVTQLDYFAPMITQVRYDVEWIFFLMLCLTLFVSVSIYFHASNAKARLVVLVYVVFAVSRMLATLS